MSSVLCCDMCGSPIKSGGVNLAATRRVPNFGPITWEFTKVKVDLCDRCSKELAEYFAKATKKYRNQEE